MVLSEKTEERNRLQVCRETLQFLEGHVHVGTGKTCWRIGEGKEYAVCYPTDLRPGFAVVTFSRCGCRLDAVRGVKPRRPGWQGGGP